MTAFIEALVDAWLALYNGTFGEFCISGVILFVVAIIAVVAAVNLIALIIKLFYIAFFGEFEVKEDEETHKKSYIISI